MTCAPSDSMSEDEEREARGRDEEREHEVENVKEASPRSLRPRNTLKPPKRFAT